MLNSILFNPRRRWPAPCIAPYRSICICDFRFFCDKYFLILLPYIRPHRKCFALLLKYPKQNVEGDKFRPSCLQLPRNHKLFHKVFKSKQIPAIIQPILFSWKNVFACTTDMPIWTFPKKSSIVVGYAEIHVKA